MIRITRKDGTSIIASYRDELSNAVQPQDIFSISADGEDLEYIQKQYRVDTNTRGLSAQYSYSIPMPDRKTSVIWFGETALMIVFNIKPYWL